MRKIHRNMLIIAGGLIIAGAAIGGAGLLMGAGIDEPVSYLTETVNSEDISIYSRYDDIVIESSDNDEITISYPDDRECTVNTENGVSEYSFTNKANDAEKWYENIEISFNTEQRVITLRLPSDFSGEVTAQSSSADIEASGVRAHKLTLESGNGDVTVDNSICDVSASSETGNVRVSGQGNSAEAESGHGSIELSSSEYEIISADSDSGDISMWDICSSAVYINNGSGNISGKEIEIGSIDIINDYGDTAIERVRVSMARAESRYGDIRLSLMGQAEDYSVNGSSDARNRIYVNSEYGDTDVSYISE